MDEEKDLQQVAEKRISVEIDTLGRFTLGGAVEEDFPVVSLGHCH